MTKHIAMGRVWDIEESIGKFDASEPEDVKFVEQVDKAYDIIWNMYKGVDGKGCDFDTEKEQILLDISSYIDRKLGR